MSDRVPTVEWLEGQNKTLNARLIKYYMDNRISDKRISEFEAEVSRLREGLNIYGRHLRICVHYSNTLATCDCGLEPLLKGGK